MIKQGPALVGSYSLLPGGPGPVLSPSGFTYNNILYYPGDPFVDSYGIVGLGFLSTTGNELNLWGNNSPANYTLYAHFADPDASFQIHNGPAVASISPISAVPEASTVIAGALLLLPLGASTLRILRKNRTV